MALMAALEDMDSWLDEGGMPHCLKFVDAHETAPYCASSICVLHLHSQQPLQSVLAQ